MSKNHKEYPKNVNDVKNFTLEINGGTVEYDPKENKYCGIANVQFEESHSNTVKTDHQVDLFLYKGGGGGAHTSGSKMSGSGIQGPVCGELPQDSKKFLDNVLNKLLQEGETDFHIKIKKFVI